jgi:hypothetical protein
MLADRAKPPVMCRAKSTARAFRYSGARRVPRAHLHDAYPSRYIRAMHTDGMDRGTHRERIVTAIRASSQPLDDDQLADQTGISPRQTVNQICRALRDAEMVRRHVGPSGKIVNEWLGDRCERPAHIPERTSTAVASMGALGGDPAGLYDLEIPAGSSREQLDAERVMLDLLGDQLGEELYPATITIPSGEHVKVDGADPDRSVLVECWAHQGPPKSAQRHKVLADAFKLAWISSTLYPRPDLILCLSDPSAAAPFLPGGRSWAARAFQDLGISVSVVTLPEELRQRVLAAQRRQYR